MTRILTKRFAGVAAAALLALTALSCSEKSLLSPLAPGAASHSVIPLETFSWLAPLGTGSANPATFDATAVTSVEICVWTGSVCSGAPVTTFSVGAGTLTANATLGEYQASWNLLNNSYITRKTYRIRALQGTTEVAAISVDVVRGRWAPTTDAGVSGFLVAANTLPIAFHVAFPPSPAVTINEVESSGGVPGDWVELYNAGTTTVDLTGYVFKDNDDTHSYVLPAGSTITPGGYLVLDEANFVFGLGAPDAARLFAPWGVLVDSYSWTTHAATTYGRCPNGTGAFVTTTSSTKGGPNDCSVTVRINEVESSGGVPGDWVELYNFGTSTVDLTGFVFKDNDDSHSYVLPPGSTIAAGGYLVLNEADFVFGLGAPDAARLYTPAGVLVDSYSWTTHAATTYGRCPNGSGPFVTTTSSTKGTANDCSAPSDVKINEVESSGGVPGDWIELTNIGASPVNISGFVLKDNDDTHIFTIPNGTILPVGGFLAFDVEVDFGLGASDAARLFSPSGALLDSYTWTSHATTTYGRCPDGTGPFVTTLASTKGAANSCANAAPTVEPWPGSNTVNIVDGLNVFGTNLSGVQYEAAANPASDVLWAVRNGPSTIFRLIFDGTIWTPDQTNGWGAGKTIFYTNGTGGPDSEDLTYMTTSSGGMYVATERDNNNGGVSRPAILRYDVTGSGTTLTATNDWNLTADLPPVGANLGLEGITFVPDSALVAQGFVDVAAGHLYNPAEYPSHGGGLFFVGLEGNGFIYVYALNHATNGFKQITSISTGFPNGVMSLRYDNELGQLWATCDDTCGGLSDIFVIDATGHLKLMHIFARPSGMPNFNNEGFGFAPQSRCVGGFKPAFWTDDSADNGHSIRMATIPCVKFP